MKKTLSIVLAMVMAVAMFAAVALIPTAATLPKSFQISSIMVSDAAGYTNPYMAVDNAAAFVENQAAYVVVTFTQYGADTDKYVTVTGGTFEVAITSSTLDLSYMGATDKEQMYNKASGAVTVTPCADVLADNGTYFDFTAASGSTPNKIMATAGTVATKGDMMKTCYTFIAVTKPATAGEVTASMKVGATAFASITSIFTSTEVTAAAPADSDSTALVVYENGTAKYTIVNIDGTDTKGTYMVFAGKSIKPADFLFNYIQNGTAFVGIGYPMAAVASDDVVTFTYNGKIVYTGLNGILGDADDKDLTDTVAAANAFFGFSFGYNNAVKNSHFEAKTSGNPVIVTDTYAYVTATVVEGDDVDIAPTGDFSANIIVVMAASAILAAAALAFVAKKARD